MSVYLPKKAKTPYYHFDFQYRGERFHGSTGCTNRREADAVERAEKEKAVRAVKTAKAMSGTVSLLIDDVAERYWQEVGQHHVNHENTDRDLERLVEYFGKTKLLSEITDDDVAGLVVWRRGHRVVRSQAAKLEDCPFVSPATVNRTTTEVLKKLFTRAKKWKDGHGKKIKFDSEPDWNAYMLAEPSERVRELESGEGASLEAATRPDYEPFFAFTKASGLRLDECLLEWPEVNWGRKLIKKTGKGGGEVTAPITTAVREILEPLKGHHPKYVFTYIAKRTREGRVKGQRYPITYSGVKTAWRRLRKRAGVQDFRFHDFRHDFATKLLRHTGDLKLVSKSLNHKSIKTTERYAHVQDNDVAAALESYTESRNKSRNNNRKAI